MKCVLVCVLFALLASIHAYLPHFWRSSISSIHIKRSGLDQRPEFRLKVKLFTAEEELQKTIEALAQTNPLLYSSQPLAEITNADIDDMGFLLSNVADCLATSPEKALSLLSTKISWLFTHNLPGLAEQLLRIYPEMRDDRTMMVAYTFIINFMEAISNETKKLNAKNQQLLKDMILASKLSDLQVKKFIEANAKELTRGDFLLYLDSEIAMSDPSSQKQVLLQTIKLLLLEEVGKKMGVDITMLPRLAAEPDLDVLREKTKEFISGYNFQRKQLFRQSIKIMLHEMQTKYKADPMLVENMIEIEKIVSEDIANISPI